MKHTFMQIFFWGHFTFMDLYVMVVKKFQHSNLNKIIYFNQDQEKYREEEVKFLIDGFHSDIIKYC